MQEEHRFLRRHGVRRDTILRHQRFLDNRNQRFVRAKGILRQRQHVFRRGEGVLHVRQFVFLRGQGSLCGGQVSCRSSLRVLGAKKKPPKHSRVSEEERCIYRGSYFFSSIP